MSKLHHNPCSNHVLSVFQWQAAIGWLLCLALLAALIILSYVLKETPPYPSAPHALYGGLHRALWAVALTWIIVACEEGYGGKFQNWGEGAQSIYTFENVYFKM